MKVNTLDTIKHSFKADVDTKDPQTGQYKDPLMHWPLRGAAYTNEVGEALRPLIGEYATLSWVPALLYIGADIYDKYKNNETEYSPSSKRGLKQAVFQGMASILLPLVAVKGGQSLFSLWGYAMQDKISIKSKEQVLNIAEEFVTNGNLRAYRDKDNECIQKFMDNVANNMDYHKNEGSEMNPFKRFFLKAEEKIAKKFVIKKQENIDNFARNTAQNVIDLRKKILNPSEEFKKTKEYQNYSELIESGQTKNVAVKNVINKKIKKELLPGKVVKTCGGFIALALLVKPIDKFVEEVLIGKIIDKGLEKRKPTVLSESS